jgi:hypothetical protein
MAFGCSSSKPAPKPFTWDAKAAAAKQPVTQAVEQDPCSPDNLKLASAEQKKKCDPTTSMSESLSPKSLSPPTRKTSH